MKKKFVRKINLHRLPAAILALLFVFCNISAAQDLSLTCRGKLKRTMNDPRTGIRDSNFDDTIRIYVFSNGGLNLRDGNFYLSCEWTDEVISCSNKSICAKSEFSLFEESWCANRLKIFRSNGEIRDTSAQGETKGKFGRWYVFEEFEGNCEKSSKKF